jgi:hypothetical protein
MPCHHNLETYLQDYIDLVGEVARGFFNAVVEQRITATSACNHFLRHYILEAEKLIVFPPPANAPKCCRPR